MPGERPTRPWKAKIGHATRRGGKKKTSRKRLLARIRAHLELKKGCPKGRGKKQNRGNVKYGSASSAN